jgi:hypothetical protein
MREPVTFPTPQPGMVATPVEVSEVAAIPSKSGKERLVVHADIR